MTDSANLSHSPGDSREAATRERILDGAVRAIARHGLGKLGMGDVSESADVSRGTVYRYFATRDHLLATVASREGQRFQERMVRAMQEAPEGAEKIRVALDHAARHAREHPILARILETDPALVLRALRERFDAIKTMVQEPFGPLLQDTEPVRNGLATVDQLADWLTRMMISAYLFPDPEPERMARDLGAVYRAFTQPELPARAKARKPRSTGRASGQRRKHVVRKPEP